MSTFVYGWIFTNTVITESIAKMPEEVSQHQILHLIILSLKRYHGLESFYRLRQIPPSLDSAMEHPTVHWPYVVIHYRLGIELYPSYEICRWEMSPTEAGFSVVSKSNLKQCLLKKRHWYLIIISLLKVIFVFSSSKYYLNTFSYNVFAFYDVEELWEGWDFSTPLAVLRIKHVWKEGWGGGRGQHASKVRLRYFLTESRDFFVDVIEGFMLG